MTGRITMNMKKSTVCVLMCLGLLTVSSSGVIVLSTSSSSPPLSPLTHDGVIDVSTDKSIYKQGETVTAIITNIGDTRIEIEGPCLTIYNERGETVFSGCLFCYWALESGESETLCWNQKDFDGEQVPTGTYVFEGSFPVIGDKTHVDNASFYIRKGKNPDAGEPLIHITQWLISLYGRTIIQVQPLTSLFALSDSL